MHLQGQRYHTPSLSSGASYTHYGPGNTALTPETDNFPLTPHLQNWCPHALLEAVSSDLALDPVLTHCHAHHLAKALMLTCRGSFPYQSQSTKSERGDCYFKSRDTNTRLQKLEKTLKGNMMSPNEHNKFPVTDRREIDCLTKNSK